MVTFDPATISADDLTDDMRHALCMVCFGVRRYGIVYRSIETKEIVSTRSLDALYDRGLIDWGFRVTHEFAITVYPTPDGDRIFEDELHDWWGQRQRQRGW